MRISDWSSDVCSSDLRAVADRSRKLLRRGLRRRLVPYGEQCGHPSTEQSVVGSGNGVMRRNSGSIGNSTCEPSASVSKNWPARSEEHTSELQSLMRISYAVFCLKTTMKYHSNETASQ